MGRAIVRKPSAFLMDEPLSNLDAKLRVQMRAEICRLQREFRTTTIYVTHDQVEAMTMGDRVAVLNGGQIEQCDSPRDLYDRPTNLFVAAFIGSPTMNFFPATVERRDGGLAAVIGSVALPLDTSALIDEFDKWVGHQITIGIPAESITAVPAHEASPQGHGHRRLRRRTGLRSHRARTRRRARPIGRRCCAVRPSQCRRHHIATTTSNLVTKLPARMTCRPGDSVTLFIDPANIHCFDPAGPSLRKGADA